ncbi:3-hydroxybutyryl-CoA dehydrogenase [Metaclostridioides mangenotii]|uniref:3-hydroxybutyryl-CoA dehydrogenase n=1 Tax=Metaclostridioides mangenotii TaxID=1540 RepID=A0ABS4E8W8_9FIRM|nr:3-hydroxybutyryl-CoA dehydrogenase [Clostridioides mangenotii]MBP1854385.1 3-hydroxybutyryl-CoA dehydrogenase [Clostridioides mangenotii]
MKLAVIGSGTMGSGIIQTIASCGQDICLKSRSKESIDECLTLLNKNLSRLVSKEKIDDAKKEEILSHVSSTIDYEDLKDMDLIIEASVENMNTKKDIFKLLDELCHSETILATNTSSLSITEIASATKRPNKVIGMHFFNPVPMMDLVEIISGQLTSKVTFDTVFELSKSINKVPVNVSESPGFVVNRILIPMINEAIGIYADGVANKEEIDEAMKLGANHPMGPLALGDLIGLDVVLAIMNVLYTEFGDTKYRPHPLLAKMVRANQLGRKTKIGFYDYNK